MLGMDTKTFDSRKHPRDGDGTFTTKMRGEAAGGTDVLTRQPDTDTSPSLGLDLSDPEVFDHIRQMAHFEVQRYRGTWGEVDKEEVVSDAIEDLAKDARSRRAAVQAGEPKEPIVNWKGYSRSVVRHVTYRHNNGTGHDAQCRKLYLIARDTKISELGRQLTNEERNKLADEVAANRPPGRRPTDGYHETPVVESKSNLALANVLNEDRHQVAVDNSEFDEGSFASDVMTKAKSSSEADRANARRRVWDVLAIRRGDVPTVEVATQSEYAAAQARKTVTSSGGALNVAQSWELGEATGDEEDALFMPFSDKMTTDEKHAVVGLLADYPRSADDIYDAAVGQATSRRTDQD